LNPVTAHDLIYELIRCRNTMIELNRPEDIERINRLIDAFYDQQPKDEEVPF